MRRVSAIDRKDTGAGFVLPHPEHCPQLPAYIRRTASNTVRKRLRIKRHAT